MIIQPITIDDVDEANQVQPKEWGSIAHHITHYVTSPHCHPIKLVEGDKIIGIGTTILHKDTAWLAHIIVHESHRNKGLGTLITEALVDSIDKNIYKTTLLVATELGEFVYKKLGFETECEYTVFKDVGIKAETSSLIIPFEERYREQLYSLDIEAYGEDRKNSIDKHIPNAFLYIQNNIAEGFYMPTFGDGLVVANTANAGIELQKYRLQTNSLCIFPTENTALASFLIEQGYSELKRVKKMFLGEKRTNKPTMIYNRVGGHLG
jgi:GNAT superfamily N-acetyltransferase